VLPLKRCRPGSAAPSTPPLAAPLFLTDNHKPESSWSWSFSNERPREHLFFEDLPITKQCRSALALVAASHGECIVFSSRKLCRKEGVMQTACSYSGSHDRRQLIQNQVFAFSDSVSVLLTG